MEKREFMGLGIAAVAASAIKNFRVFAIEQEGPQGDLRIVVPKSPLGGRIAMPDGSYMDLTGCEWLATGVDFDCPMHGPASATVILQSMGAPDFAALSLC